MFGTDYENISSPVELLTFSFHLPFLEVWTLLSFWEFLRFLGGDTSMRPRRQRHSGRCVTQRKTLTRRSLSSWRHTQSRWGSVRTGACHPCGERIRWYSSFLGMRTHPLMFKKKRCKKRWLRTSDRSGVGREQGDGSLARASLGRTLSLSLFF